jgi:hypothetical protein
MGLFSWGDKPHVSLEENHKCSRQSIQHIVSLGELGLFLQEYFLQFRCFKVHKGSFSSKQAYSAKVKKHTYLSKENHVC